MSVIADYFGGVDPYLTLYPTVISKRVGEVNSGDRASWSADLNGQSYLGSLGGVYLGYRVPFTPSINCALVPVVLGAPGAAASGAKVSSGVAPGLAGSIASSAASVVGSVISIIAAAQAQKAQNISTFDSALCEVQTSLNNYGPAIDNLVATGQISASQGITSYLSLIAQLKETLAQVATAAELGASAWNQATLDAFGDVTTQFYTDLAASVAATAAAAPAQPSTTAQLSTTAGVATVAPTTAVVAAVTGVSPTLLLVGAAAIVLLFILL